jgi:hypothetical protein
MSRRATLGWLATPALLDTAVARQQVRDREELASLVVVGGVPALQCSGQRMSAQERLDDFAIFE